MAKGKLYDVELTATVSGGSIQWSVKSNGLGHSNNGGMDKFTFNKNTNNMSKKDFYLIQFTLVDNTNLNLKFPKNASDALWACVAADPSDPYASCPHVAPATPSNQFVPLIVLNDYCLLAMNKDDKDETLVFALNFNSDNGPVQWDPIADNQDGGKS